MSRIPFDRVNWITSSFLFGTALVAAIGAPWYVLTFGIDLFQILLFLFYVAATAMSITLGYHRLFSHRAFQAAWPVRFSTLVFGACAFENSCLDWVSDHRRHHKHVDHDEDPYDISKGFFWAHIGWLLFKLNPVPPLDNVADLQKDKLVMWQHRWVNVIAVLVGFVLPALLGYWWGGWEAALGAFLLAGVTRVVVVQHSTFFINSLCHTIGRQPYSDKSSARDSAIMAFLTFGEGYHNYHHSFQHDYRNGVKPWNYDPTKWLIWLLAQVGLARNLRRVPASKILLAEMARVRDEAEARMAQFHRAHSQDGEGARQAFHALEVLKELSHRLVENYHELEKAVHDRVEISKHRLEQWRAETFEVLRHLAELNRDMGHLVPVQAASR